MDLTVFWTDIALERLEYIFDYYKNKASDKVAKELVKRIVDKTILLETQPNIGQVEELLQDRKNKYRYLVEGNYKIIYWVEKPFVKIATVFDCRQNPVKMREVK